MVVRNHEGGTCSAAGAVGPKGASVPGSGRERGISAEGQEPERIPREEASTRVDTGALSSALKGRSRSRGLMFGGFGCRATIGPGIPRRPGRQRPRVTEGAEKATRSATRPFA